MSKKIRLTEDELTSMIERLVKEHASVGGFGYGFVQEDTEGEETYNYGEDEGADHKEEMDLEHDMDMAPKDRIGAIEKHLDALKRDMSFDSGREDRGEKGTSFMESRRRRPVMSRRVNRRR